ncbi:hypothetical protein J5N97_018944 [Dioscorea zingiberensis]|uniref:DUF7054 domain-containing protein n=1 Tax=Dioscorea zingiberensis TaxID=325984 RepID=A0A9D5CDT8_9LILI|nr:hypothetical protein J5N97_018944 [Dioscorea zingiberensis]
MPERHPKRRRAPAISLSRRSHPPKTSFRRSKPPKATRLIRRTSSEPILWTFRLIPDDGERGIGEAVFLPRPHTCADIFAPVSLGSPSPSPRLSMEGEAVKVVVNVTVEGSPGPVRAMVRLGASVEEAIGVVLDRYGREGRSPKLESFTTASFQLHHSHFSLHSLDKSEKIGEVGSRSFYLRKSPNNDSFASTESNTAAGAARGSEIELLRTDPTHFFLSFIAKRLDKIGRRTRRLWKVFVCMTCG